MGKSEYEKGLEITLALANYWAFKYGNTYVSSTYAIKNNIENRGYLYDPYIGGEFKGTYHIHLLWMSDEGDNEKKGNGHWKGLTKLGVNNTRFSIIFENDSIYKGGEYIKNLAAAFEELLEMPVKFIEDFDNNRLDKSRYKMFPRFYEEKYRNYDDIAKEKWMK